MSLFVVPVVAVLVAVALAKALPRLDRIIPRDRVAWYLFAGEAESARELLGTIATSLMTVTGVVFSITVVVLQLASSQFSPRVLRTFLEDPFTRFAMGVFIGSFVYTVALMPEVRSGRAPEAEFVPGLSVFVGFVSGLVSVVVFVRYIHVMAHSIRAVHVLARVAEDARDGMASYYPDREADPEAERATAIPSGGALVTNPGDAGVVAWIEERALVELAARLDVVLVVVPRMGEFVPRGAPIFRVIGPGGVDAEELDALLGLEAERTAHQDPAFGIRQLVDVAERALSPGINDPATAVQALDQIHDLLRALARRAFPPLGRCDPRGQVRLYVADMSWEEYVHLAFDEIRHYGRGSLQVTKRIRAALLDLLTVAPPHRRAPLEEQLGILDETIAKSFGLPEERALARSPDCVRD